MRLAVNCKVVCDASKDIAQLILDRHSKFFFSELAGCPQVPSLLPRPQTIAGSDVMLGTLTAQCCNLLGASKPCIWPCLHQSVLSLQSMVVARMAALYQAGISSPAKNTCSRQSPCGGAALGVFLLHQQNPIKHPCKLQQKNLLWNARLHAGLESIDLVAISEVLLQHCPSLPAVPPELFLPTTCQFQMPHVYG